jgi:hypothetical protein
MKREYMIPFFVSQKKAEGGRQQVEEMAKGRWLKVFE